MKFKKTGNSFYNICSLESYSSCILILFRLPFLYFIFVIQCFRDFFFCAIYAHIQVDGKTDMIISIRILMLVENMHMYVQYIVFANAYVFFYLTHKHNHQTFIGNFC